MIFHSGLEVFPQIIHTLFFVFVCRLPATTSFGKPNETNQVINFFRWITKHCASYNLYVSRIYLGHTISKSLTIFQERKGKKKTMTASPLLLVAQARIQSYPKQTSFYFTEHSKRSQSANPKPIYRELFFATNVSY